MSVRFLLSAHASHEELFLFRRLTEELAGPRAPQSVSVSWRVTPKQQPAHTKFKVPAVDAPNVNGARIFGLAPGQVGRDQGAADISALRSAVEAGRVAALYVFDPGPDGSIGDTNWIVAARTSGKLPLLVVQGVLMTDLARAADFVLPGASVRREGRVLHQRQGTSSRARRSAIKAPGEAMEDWQIVVNLATALGVAFDYTESAHIRGGHRRADAERSTRSRDCRASPSQRPMSARTWLEASNPSERWKWEFLYQDLPPVKGSVDTSSLPTPPGVIRLNEVK